MLILYPHPYQAAEVTPLWTLYWKRKLFSIIFYMYFLFISAARLIPVLQNKKKSQQIKAKFPLTPHPPMLNIQTTMCNHATYTKHTEPSTAHYFFLSNLMYNLLNTRRLRKKSERKAHNQSILSCTHKKEWKNHSSSLYMHCWSEIVI